MTTKECFEVGANIATMFGGVGIVFLFIQHFYNKDVRNLQLMQRCIDGFRHWTNSANQEINYQYLELMNEELFYIQRGLIDKEIALEWIEGMLDFIQVYGKNGFLLSNYNNQVNLEALSVWQSREGYFLRIQYFIYTDLPKEYSIPSFTEIDHSDKKRTLAHLLLKRIKKYRY